MCTLDRDEAVRAPVPGSIVLYALLSLADLGLTLAAFAVGAKEANPALAYFVPWGLFEFAKLSITLLVCCMAVKLWCKPITARVMFGGNVLLGLVFAYHLTIWIR